MIRGADLTAIRLKKVDTQVRRRNGTVFLERRLGDKYVTSETGRVDVPDYIKEQESGVSNLVPRSFDCESGRWVPFRESDQFVAVSSQKIRVISYNVCFDQHNQHDRATALFDILGREDADLVFLQEVTPQFLGWLRSEAFVRTRYLLSDAVGTTLRGSFAYGVIGLVRRPTSLSCGPTVNQEARITSSEALQQNSGAGDSVFMAVRGMSLHSLPSKMNRSALVVKVDLFSANSGHCGTGEGLPGLPIPSSLSIASSHLESLDNTPLRIAQLDHIFTALTPPDRGTPRPRLPTDATGGGNSATADHPRPACPEFSLFVGDMNFDDGAPEEAAVPPGWLDCWLSLHSNSAAGDEGVSPQREPHSLEADVLPRSSAEPPQTDAESNAGLPRGAPPLPPTLLRDLSSAATMPVDDHFGRPTRIDRFYFRAGSCSSPPPPSPLLSPSPGAEVRELAVPPTLTPTCMRLLGTQPFSSERPSDHYGLVCDFSAL